MDAFQQRLLNSQRETYFLLKPDAPKTNAFHVPLNLFCLKTNGCLSCQRCPRNVNIEPFLFDKTNAPKMDAFMKDAFMCLNVKPVLLRQNAPKWMPFSKDF